ncbi:MAG: ATP-binding cassette domain-containing protein [Bacteroidota bacterium]|nr:MAG: ATP-binding cassette domain-containing protein [Bacteroidota bacterium]
MISLENLSLQYTGQRIFEDISLMIGPKDKLGLVGKNGAGKSTMLKLMTGEVLPDKGQVVVASDVSLGYLPQQLACNDTRTVFDETMTAFEEFKKIEQDIEHIGQQLQERTDYETDSYLELVELLTEKNDRLHIIDAGNTNALCEQTLIGLGFKRSDFNRPTKEFSGGWRMRIELAKILLRSPDIFLLDEPTNHLDIESIQWLEDFLSTYNGAIVLISHDRAFLDKITKRTVEISLGKLHDYKTNYSNYLEQRKDRREKLLSAYRNQQKQLDDTKEFIERFRYKASKAVQVQSRIKQLEKVDIIEVDEEDLSSINIKFPPAPRSGTVVFEARSLTKAYGSKVILDKIDMQVERGEKLAFIGKNGEGKTTLSRIIVNELEATGEYKLGHNVKLGYFAQNQDELLDGDKTVLETIDAVAVGDVRTRIRDILGAFLFGGEDVDKKVRVLSGGEKSRLSMAKLLLEPYNLLVLDEPTNHLDIRSKDILKKALLAYDGTLILVSHDREFLNGLTTRFFEFSNKKVKEHRETIYEFLARKRLNSLDELNRKQPIAGQKADAKTSKNKLTYEQRKELDKEIRKIERCIEEIEKSINRLEAENAEAEKKLAQNEQSNQDLFSLYENNKKEIEKLLKEWEEHGSQLEELLNQRNL